MEGSKPTHWQVRAKEIDDRFIRLAQAQGTLLTQDEIVRFLVMAICGEAGELANIAKKMWRGDSVSREAVEDEMADIRIYLEHLCRHLELDIDQACERKLDVVADRLAIKERRAANASQ